MGMVTRLGEQGRGQFRGGGGGSGVGLVKLCRWVEGGVREGEGGLGDRWVADHPAGREGGRDCGGGGGRGGGRRGSGWGGAGGGL